MAWLCRVDTLCDTITTLIYDLMDASFLGGDCKRFSGWTVLCMHAGEWAFHLGKSQRQDTFCFFFGFFFILFILFLCRLFVPI